MRRIQPVILTAHELKHLARTAAELMTLCGLRGVLRDPAATGRRGALRHGLRDAWITPAFAALVIHPPGCGGEA